MPPRKLTDTTVKALVAKPEKVRTDWFDKLLPGFGLRVSPAGAASWFVFYRLDGKLIRDIFARYPAKGLAVARDEARTRLDVVDRGRNPRQEEARQRAMEARQRAETFGVIGNQYKASHLPKLRSGDELWTNIEKDLLPEWTDTPVRDITRGAVTALLDRIETDRGLYARNRRLALIRHILNFALDRELVDANVAARIGMLDEAERERILTDAELVEIWHAAGQLVAPGNALVRQLILSGQRRNEVSETQWREVDEAERLWTVPAARMKSKLVHEVPLPPMMLALIRGVPTANDRKIYVFASPYRKEAPIGGFSQLKEQLDRQILEARQKVDPKAKPMAPWRLHDLRRTMRSGLSQLRIPAEIAERVIGHVPGGIRRVYDRFEYRDEKRQALNAWCSYVFALVSPEP
jgi:integrase